MSKKQFRLYSIDKYKGKNEDFIDKTGFKLFGINDLCKELESNNGYHFRIDPIKNYIFFGDCDGYKGKTFKDFANLFISFLNKYYDISLNFSDFSYTINKSKKGSYHYSIKSIFCSCKKLKEIHKNFLDLESKNLTYIADDKSYNIIDTTIYSKHWFRYPNQHKEGKDGSEHIIKQGKMIDFVVDFIPNEAISVENKKFIGNNHNELDDELDKIPTKIICTNNYMCDDNLDMISVNDVTNIEKEDYREILNNLNKKRIDDYKDWIEIGQILKNSSDGNMLLDEWIKWSSKSKKFEVGECEKKWKSFKKTKDGLKLGSLLLMLKNDNLIKFEEIKKKLSIKKIITENRQYFPDNDLIVDKILSNSSFHHIELLDDFCPIFGDKHNERNLYLEMNKFGQMILKCFCPSCRGKAYPNNDTILLKKHQINSLFNFTQNNVNITINESKYYY